MGRLEEHKAERRARILAAARRLIAARGYDGLTMRDLAVASRVSVPTLYNLFGGKRALLLGELEATFTAVADGLAGAGGRGVVERAAAMCEAANRELLAVPRFWRELVHLFFLSEETEPIRREFNARYIELMAAVLRDAQRDGELVAWVDPTAVAGRSYGLYMDTLIEWARGALDDEAFRGATELGMCLILLGLGRGRAAEDLERRAREAQRRLRTAGPKRARRGG